MQRYKCLFLVLVLASIGLCSSCLSYSLYPWFADEVRMFDERLLGKWGDDDESYTVKQGPGQTYWITARANGNRTDYRATLARIGEHHYLDLKPERSTDSPDPWELEAHLLCKLAFEPDRLRVVCLDDERLEKMVGAGELRGARVQDDKFLVVSATEELQKFVARHGPAASLWIEEAEEEDNWLPRM